MFLFFINHKEIFIQYLIKVKGELIYIRLKLYMVCYF